MRKEALTASIPTTAKAAMLEISIYIKEWLIIFLTLIWLAACAGGGYWAFTHHRKWLVALSAVLFIFGGLVALGASQPTVQTKTVKVGTQRLTAAQRESRQLAVSSSRQAAAFAVVDSQAADSESASKSRADSTSEAVASSKASARSISKAESKAATQAATAASSQATQTSRASHKQGNLDTHKAKKIVGNRNSKIYHTPDQAGYHMNSSNAVYFNTEAQARAAGYRKALR
ncbi:sunset domain-containing protein [Levilactobacillus sp. N40-8-2]|uniref:sunset domain-containing protein n=1 Tax=Levilactobacillus muriae TaxID=3238987 RepID=UPI0038B3B453